MSDDTRKTRPATADETAFFERLAASTGPLSYAEMSDALKGQYNECQRLRAEVQHWRDAASAVGATDGHALVLNWRDLLRERDEAMAALALAREERDTANRRSLDWEARLATLEGLLERISEAATGMDWTQVVLNGGPPCFHLEVGRFCLRAERWAGHGTGENDIHPFVPTLAALDTGGRQP